MLKKFSIVLLLSLTIAGGATYATSNAGPSLKSWFENKITETRTNVNQSLIELVRDQINLVSSDSEKRTWKLQQDLKAYSDTRNADIEGNIINQLKTHEIELNKASTVISSSTSNDFNEIMSKINHKTDDVMKSVEEYNDRSLLDNHNLNLPDLKILSEKKNASSKQLNDEINRTKETIMNLESAASTESNPIVKNFIEQKIMLLKDLIIILES